MKEKIKNILNKHDKILVFIFFIIAVTSLSVNVKIEANDELWNFSNIYKMYNGEMIYRDINVIITPLFFYIGKILFKILGANYLTFRIYNTIIFIAIYYTIYCLFKTLDIKKIKAFTYTLTMYILSLGMIITGANYNALAMLFIILGVLCCLKEEKLGKKKIILEGILIFIVFMCKQTIGVLYIIGVIIYELTKKDKIKNKIKILIQQLGISAIILGIFLGYLALTENLYPFINYTILGTIEFKNENFYCDNAIFTYIIQIPIIIVILWALKSKKITIEEKVRKNIITLLTLSIPLMLIAYPIINDYHVLQGNMLAFITTIYFIEKIMLKEILETGKVIKAMKILDIIIIIGTVCFNIYILIITPYYLVLQQNKYKPYYGGTLKNQDEISRVVNYIEEQERNGTNIIIMSYKANLYNNILKKNNGDFDVPFYGNLGIEGEKGLIEKIKKLKNTNILIEPDSLAYQEIKEVKDYIVENYEQIGKIEEYDIYKLDQ